MKPDWNSNLLSGTTIAKCPIAMTISYLNVLDSTTQLRGGAVKFPPQFIEALEPDVVTAFFLVDQCLRGEESFWARYIQSLPRMGQMTTAQYFEGEDLEWLRGTNLFQARERRLEAWREMYEKGMEVLRSSGFEGCEGYTWLVSKSPRKVH